MKYLLRWRFHWFDRPSKFGMWSHPGEQKDLATKAWYHNKEGLILAVIEGKDVVTREVKVLVECPGQDYRNFQWVALASVVPGALAGGGSVTPLTRIGGLKVQTRNEEITVMDDGSITTVPFTAEDQHFATYGK